MVEEKKPYRISVVLEEYDSDGFWTLFNQIEIIEDNKIEESLENIAENCKKYMKKRGLIK